MMDSLRSDNGRPALRMKRVQSLEGVFTRDVRRSVEVSRALTKRRVGGYLEIAGN